MSTPANGARSRRRSRVRPIHRWLGIVSSVLVLWLSITGIALNNARDWGLDRTYVQLTWLLNWYGIEAPPPSASFRIGERWATLLGEQLYFGGRRIATDVSEMTGAVRAANIVAISSATELFVLTTEGGLVERLDARELLPGRIDALGTHDGRIVCLSAGRSYAADESVLTLTPADPAWGHTARWSHPSDLPAGRLASVQKAYLGSVLTVERLLADLHGGRLFTRLGPRIVDAAGILLILVGVTGLMVWSRRNGSPK
jgi:hypothetical protein